MGNSGKSVIAIALCLLTFGASGCGGDTESSTSAPVSTTQETSTTVPGSVAPSATDPEASDPSTAAPEASDPPSVEAGSAAGEDIPLPPGARPSQGAAYDYVNAWQVPGSDFDSVVKFYDDEMPEGEDWKDWTWCDTGTPVGSDPSRTYERGSNEILSVTIIKTDPPVIQMGVAQAGPC
jgi:hypothetical protein